MQSKLVTRAGLVLAAVVASAACTGDVGKDGTQGGAGANGAAGHDGSAGSEGKNGADGKSGSDGKNGADGRDGSAGPEGPRGGARSIAFDDVGFAKSKLEKHGVRVARHATVDGKSVAIDYQVLLRSRQDPARPNRTCDLTASPGTCFGVLPAASGKPLKDDGGEIIVANSQDFTSLLEAGGKTFMVNAFESTPSSMFVSAVTQDAAGTMAVTSTKAIDLSGIDGMWFACAGSRSPWGTHLASDEQDGPDPRAFDPIGSWSDLRAYAGEGGFSTLKRVAQYWGVDLTDANVDGLPDGGFADFKSKYSPYFNGFAVEVKVDATGKPTVSKHYAMGRFAMESPRVMPDRKTVLLTDDDNYVGLFMFVADAADDLDAGTLYAMRAYQTSPRGGAAYTADIQWINLGHATSAEVRALIHPTAGARATFADIFDVEAPAGDGTCPTAGFKSIRAGTGALECLKLRAGRELAASRLETLRYAAYLGATTELSREEGLTYAPDTNVAYVALTKIEGAMGNQTTGPDHIHVAENKCGVVYGLDIGPWTDGAKKVTDYAPLNWYPVLSGVPVDYPAGSDFQGNTCSVGGIANPDNVSYIPLYGTLIVGEDSGSGHQNDAIWTYHLATRKLTRIMTTPYGSETTSMDWYPRLGQFGYMMAVIQHPYGETDQGMRSEADSTGTDSWVGVVGPFPPLD